MIDKLIGAMLAIIVGVVLLPVIMDSAVDVLYTNGNYSTPATLPTGVASLVGILPLIFVVIVVGGAIAYFRYK